MCGVVGYIGDVSEELLSQLVYESGVRGLHNTGSKRMAGAGIFHTRYCTSGETHQPLHFNGRWMAFNGVIHMGTKQEMEEEYGIRMETDNDGEVVLQLCPTPEDAAQFLKNNPATFAGLWIEEGRLTALRNHGRPLWVHEGENVILASTKDIFTRCGISDCRQLEPFKPEVWTF